MNTNLATLIACESVLDPILEQLATVLDEHYPDFTGLVARRWTACDQQPPPPA